MTENDTPTVYLVDDDLSVRESLRSVLETYNLAVNAFGSAKAFIASLPEHGCLVTDIDMPEVNGVELLEELKKRRSPIAAIAVTARTEANLWEEVERAGALALFAKPVDVDVLVQTIERCISPEPKHDRTGLVLTDRNNESRVLIAEDQLMVADRLEEILVGAGYHVCGIARTVEDGVALGKMHKPDLAVLDVRLGRTGKGVDIARHLHGGIKCGVLYVTGDHSRSDALTTADGIASIAKPYHSGDVLRALKIVREMVTSGAATPPFPSGFRLLSESPARSAGA